MAHEEQNELAHEFPRAIGKPATQALIVAGYTRLDQLTKVTEADLLKLHGMGPKALGILRSTLEARGQSFAEPVKRAKKSNRSEPQ
jgi:hypothetical protein